MRKTLIVTGFVVAMTVCSVADAQFSEQQRIGRYRSAGRAQSSTAAVLSRPTVSPYLAIADINGTGLDTSQNYFTQVRPRIERQKDQQRQQVQLQQIQQNMASLRSQAARQSQNGARVTGHPTRFNYYLQYYPTLNR